MACSKGCGGSGKPEGSMIALRASDMAPTAGLYLTTSNDDCSGPYTGGEATKVWVVGIGTPDEEVFTNARRGEAIAKARANELTIDSLPTTQLCHEVVEAALAG